MDLTELKSLILGKEPLDFVEDHIVKASYKNFTAEQMELVISEINRATGIEIKTEEVVLVGSAKLGFGLFEKKRREATPLPAFRPFDAVSDIDIAFACPKLFDAVWGELATYACGKTRMPFRMDNLGDYMVYGWIRPDHIPREARLRTYDQWNDTIRGLGAKPEFKRRKISGALYRDMEFLKKYQARGIAACRKKLELE